MAKEETSTYLVDTPRPSGFQNHCVFSFVAGHHLKKYQGEHHTSVACKKKTCKTWWASKSKTQKCCYILGLLLISSYIISIQCRLNPHNLKIVPGFTFFIPTSMIVGFTFRASSILVLVTQPLWSIVSVRMVTLIMVSLGESIVFSGIPTYWCVLRREFSGMIHWLTTKFYNPSNPDSHPFPT